MGNGITSGNTSTRSTVSLGRKFACLLAFLSLASGLWPPAVTACHDFDQQWYE